MLHELWEDPDGDPYTFVFAGPAGDDARSTLTNRARLTWTVEAASHFEAMTLYYKHQGWGEYITDFPDQDRQSYVEFGEGGLKSLLEGHKDEPWPKSVERGDVIAGVDLVMVSADIAGLASSALDTRPMPEVCSQMAGLVAELESVRDLLAVDAQSYFDGLIRIGRSVIDL